MPLLGLGKKKKKEKRAPTLGSVGRSASPVGVHPAQLEEEERKARLHSVDAAIEDEEKVMVDVPVLCRAQAICPYEPDDFEVDADIIFLRFDTGAFIDVIDQDESGWWEGFVDGQNGIFPGTYVRVVEIYGTEGAAAFVRHAGEAAYEEEDPVASDPNVQALQQDNYDSDSSCPPDLEEIPAGAVAPAPRAVLSASVEADEANLARLANGEVFVGGDEPTNAAPAPPESSSPPAEVQSASDKSVARAEPERQVAAAEPETQPSAVALTEELADFEHLLEEEKQSATALEAHVHRLREHLEAERKKVAQSVSRAAEAESQAAAWQREMQQAQEKHRQEMAKMKENLQQKSNAETAALKEQLLAEQKAHAATKDELVSTGEQLVAAKEQLEIAKAHAVSEANSAGALEAEIARRQAAESALAAATAEKEKGEASFAQEKQAADARLLEAEAQVAELNKQLSQARATVESLQQQVLSVVPDLTAQPRAGSPARFVSVPADSPGTMKRAMKPAPSLPAAGQRRPAPESRRFARPAPPVRGRRLTGTVPSHVATRPLPQPPV